MFFIGILFCIIREDIIVECFIHFKVADFRNAVIVARNPGSAIR